jgi:hypothetical protein
MPRAIGVIVHVEQDGPWFTRLLTSLDAQTLDYDSFEVVLAVAEPDSAIGRRAVDVARRRPNLRVVLGARAPEAETDARWLVDLGPAARFEPTLTPDALERLVQVGDAGGYDAVVGATIDRALSTTADIFAAPPDEAARTVPDAAAWSLPRGVIARRAGSDGSGAVGVLTGSPAALVARHDVDTVTGAVKVTECTARWGDGRLLVTVAGTAADAAPGAEVRFALVERSSGITHWLPSTTHSPVTDRFAGSTEIDVLTAAQGRPVPEGSWQVRVGVHGTGDAWSRRLPVPLPPRNSALGPALINGRFIVPVAGKAALVLDVGARTTSPIGRLAATDATIADSARGTLLTVAVPALTGSGPRRIEGGLLIGGLKVPATLVVEGGRARVEAYVSGLSGSSPLSTQFGRGRPAPTGLMLDVAPIGTMSVRSAEPASAKPKSARPGPAKPAQRAARPRVQDRVPPRLRPIAAALARNEFARRMYRTISGR